MISVIIPVYNAMPFLLECLASISAQTFPDWECILVDDGSTDGSGEICQQWADSDARFRVFRQKNGGPASARNMALRVFRGDYVAFVDADDYVEPEYLSSLFDALNKEGADLAVCGIRLATDKGFEKQICPISNDFFELCKQNLLYGPVVKLYRKSLLELSNARFDVKYRYGEDLMFNISYLKVVSRITTSDICAYHYRRQIDGTLSTIFRADGFQTDYTQWKKLYELFVEKDLINEEAKNYLYGRLWGIVYDGIFRFSVMPSKSRQYLFDVLSIPEIDDLHRYVNSFSCSWWIKICIIKRRANWFYLFFKYIYKY